MSDEIKYANPLKRSIAFNIDLMITGFIRVVCFKILAFFTIQEELKLLQEDMKIAIDKGVVTQDSQESFRNLYQPINMLQKLCNIYQQCL